MATVLAGVTSGFLTSATTANGTYTQFAKCLTYSEADPGVSQLDATTIETAMPDRDYVAGRNSGQRTWTFGIQFDPDSTMDKAIITARNAQTPLYFRLNWPDSTDSGSVSETWTALGRVSTVTVSAEDNGIITAQLVLALTGAVTTAAVS